MRVISRNDLQQLVPMERAIAAVEQAFVQLSTNEAVVPLRQHIDLAAGDLALVMPAYLEASGALGVKLLTLFPRNTGTPPVIQAIVTLWSTANGAPLALMDGTYLTTLRTGAASGVATRYMARGDAQVLALFGAGAVALHQVLAVCTVRAVERVWLINRTHERAEQLQAELRVFGAPIPQDIRIAHSSAEALSEANIVCTATSSSTPLFDHGELRPGTHINGIGSYRPHMQEVPSATVARARVVVDQRQAAWAEAGDLVVPRDQGIIEEAHIVAELGEVARGQIAGRTSRDETTFFKSVGNAAQDVAVAHLALNLAQTHGLGVEVDLSHTAGALRARS